MILKIRQMLQAGCVDHIYDGFDRISISHNPAEPPDATKCITEPIIMDADVPASHVHHVMHVWLVDSSGRTPERCLGVNAKAWLMSDSGKTLERLDLQVGVRVDDGVPPAGVYGAPL